MVYPSTIEVGTKMPDLNRENFRVGKIEKNLIKNRTVEAKETIITKAGTFECFKITYVSEIDYTNDNVSMFKSSIKITEWMAIGIGLVKSISEKMNGEIFNRKELIAMEK